MLIGVQGVGPKVALAVLSGGRPRELLNAIASGDAARFQAVPGIGKRTAERIIVELREKVAGRVSDEIVVRRTRPTIRARSRARACSGSASARRRPTGCSTTADGDDARGPDLRGAQGGAVTAASARPGWSAIQDPGGAAAEDDLDRSLRPRRLEDFVGQERVKEQLAVFIEAARGARRGARPRAAGRPARARQDLAGADRGERAGGRVRADRGPGARAQGRRGQLPDRARARAACSSSTRSTACRARSRRPSTRRWRTAGCRSPSARARARGWSPSTCPSSR